MKIEINNDELIDLMDLINSEKDLIKSELSATKSHASDLSNEINDLKLDLNQERLKNETLTKNHAIITGLDSPTTKLTMLKQLLDICIKREANPKSRRIPMIRLIRDLLRCNVKVAKEFVDQFYGEFTGKEMKQLPLSTEVVSMPIPVSPSNFQS